MNFPSVTPSEEYLPRHQQGSSTRPTRKSVPTTRRLGLRGGASCPTSGSSATLDFWNTYLKAQDAARARLLTDAEQPPLSSIQSVP